MKWATIADIYELFNWIEDYDHWKKDEGWGHAIEWTILRLNSYSTYLEAWHFIFRYLMTILVLRSARRGLLLY